VNRFTGSDRAVLFNGWLAYALTTLAMPVVVSDAAAANTVLTCTVDFRVVDDITLSSLQWNTDYQGAPGSFSGSGAQVDCSSEIEGALDAYTDHDDEKLLEAGIISVDGFDGPARIARCIFKASTAPHVSDFEITVLAADDPDLNPITPFPEVVVESIDCAGAPPVCGDGVKNEAEACDDGNSVNTDGCVGACMLAKCGDSFVRTGIEECDDANLLDGDGCSQLCERQQICGDATDDGTILASDAFRVLRRAVGVDVECPVWICDVDGKNGIATSDALRVLRRSVDIPTQLTCGDPKALILRITSPTLLGALQLDVDYSGVSGEIGGSGSAAHCECLLPDLQCAFNDKPERVLSASFVSITGIPGPRAIARCEFDPAGSVDSDDFTITVLDAEDLDGNEADQPTVKVVPD
jgi:cysteine-rich repeat protein